MLRKSNLIYINPFSKSKVVDDKKPIHGVRHVARSNNKTKPKKDKFLITNINFDDVIIPEEEPEQPIVPVENPRSDTQIILSQQENIIDNIEENRETSQIKDEHSSPTFGITADSSTQIIQNTSSERDYNNIYSSAQNHPKQANLTNTEIPQRSNSKVYLPNNQIPNNQQFIQNPFVHGENPPVQGQNPFVHGENPFKQGQNPFVHGENPPVQGQNPFVHGENPFKQGQNPFVHGENPFKQGQNPFVHGENQLAQGQNPQNQWIPPTNAFPNPYLPPPQLNPVQTRPSFYEQQQLKQQQFFDSSQPPIPQKNYSYPPAQTQPPAFPNPPTFSNQTQQQNNYSSVDGRNIKLMKPPIHLSDVVLSHEDKNRLARSLKLNRIGANKIKLAQISKEILVFLKHQNPNEIPKIIKFITLSFIENTNEAKDPNNEMIHSMAYILSRISFNNNYFELLYSNFAKFCPWLHPNFQPDEGNSEVENYKHRKLNVSPNITFNQTILTMQCIFALICDWLSYDHSKIESYSLPLIKSIIEKFCIKQTEETGPFIEAFFATSAFIIQKLFPHYLNTITEMVESNVLIYENNRSNGPIMKRSLIRLSDLIKNFKEKGTLEKPFILKSVDVNSLGFNEGDENTEED
ncbi:hypothetical protein TRFO_27777 [Tritrichomonas foetus]|uniref:Uncharacterized protein n=1 Tax=Tritrichomonas foetus TaxID=1144522 RepID=A0A1J4JZQ1_9EUKA|nr:hypothetical protein TRFO_27777 [Tritrichomonas foetus]|eukprot:OHT04641.1 hypothetical protein TRFO_27777 [Tritrichomonas foetus]